MESGGNPQEPAPEEFCAKPPRMALIGVFGLYYLMVQGYVLGVGFVLLAMAMADVPLVWRPLARVIQAASPQLQLQYAAGALGILVLGAFQFWLGHSAWSALRRPLARSLTIDSTTISVTETRGEQYAIPLAKIARMRVSASPWSHDESFVRRIVLSMDSGEEVPLLVGRYRDVRALVETIAGRAGLAAPVREKRWEVYFRREGAE